MKRHYSVRVQEVTDILTPDTLRPDGLRILAKIISRLYLAEQHHRTDRDIQGDGHPIKQMSEKHQGDIHGQTQD
jgi:hypothetical protein